MYFVRKRLLVVAMLLAAAGVSCLAADYPIEIGKEVDQFNGVKVFYNGDIGHSSGRNVAADGYNIGIKYQCVEFIKRYYYEHLHHKMPDARGNAKDFFDPAVKSGHMNPSRALLQYSNGASEPPKPDDLVVLGPSAYNSYGHVAIVTSVNKDSIEIIQQNPGPQGKSRATIALTQENGNWTLQNPRILGWLRMPANTKK